MFTRSISMAFHLREFLQKLTPSLGHECESLLHGSAKFKLLAWHRSFLFSHTDKLLPKLTSPLTITLESGCVGRLFYMCVWSTTTKTNSFAIQSFDRFKYKEAARLYQWFFGPGKEMYYMNECFWAQLCKYLVRLEHFLHLNICADIFWLEILNVKTLDMNKIHMKHSWMSVAKKIGRFSLEDICI